MGELQEGLVDVVVQFAGSAAGGLFLDLLFFAVFEECLNNSQGYHRRLSFYLRLKHLILQRLIITHIRNQIQQHNRIGPQLHLPKLHMIRHGHRPITAITNILGDNQNILLLHHTHTLIIVLPRPRPTLLRLLLMTLKPKHTGVLGIQQKFLHEEELVARNGFVFGAAEAAEELEVALVGGAGVEVQLHVFGAFADALADVLFCYAVFYYVLVF